MVSIGARKSGTSQPRLGRQQSDNTNSLTSLTIHYDGPADVSRNSRRCFSSCSKVANMRL